MTVDQYIALGASIGACLSAIAAFLTMRILVRQQRAVYRPDLALSRAMVRSTPCSHLPVPRMWTDESCDSVAALREELESRRAENLEDRYSDRRLFMNIRNIGMGSAGNVSVRWTFPMKGAVRQVQIMARGNSALSFAHGRLNVRTDAGVALMGWRSEQREVIDHIGTVSSEDTSLSLAVPYTYGIAVSALIYYGAQWPKIRHPPIPMLRLDLSYTDIGQHKHKASFDIHFNFACGPSPNGEIVYGYLEHKRRKRSLLFDWLHRFVHSRVVLPSYLATRRISDDPSYRATAIGRDQAEDTAEDTKEAVLR